MANNWVDDPDFADVAAPVAANKGAAISKELRGNWVDDPDFVAPVVDVSESQPERSILGAAADIGRMVYDIPTQTQAAVGNLLENEDPHEKYDWRDKWRLAGEQRTKERLQVLGEKSKEKTFIPGVTRGDIAQAGGSTGFSGVSMGAGAAGAAVGSPLGPIGKTAGFLLASGAAAYKMDKSMFTSQLIDATNSALMEERGSEMTVSERNELLRKTADARRAHALWEAGPEAVGNLLTVTGVGSIFKGVSKKVVGKIVGGLAKMYGGELATETVTQMGQQRAEAETGLTTEEQRDWVSAEDWAQSLKEVYPQTMVISSLMGGAGAIAGGAAHLVKKPSEQAKSDAKTLKAGKEILQQKLGLPNRPYDTMFAFSDGSIGTQSQIDAYIKSLPENERAHALASLMYGAKEVQSEARTKNAALTAVMGDNKAAKAAIDSGSQAVVESMLRVSPRAAAIISEMKAKAAEVEKPTAMSEAFAKAKVNRRTKAEPVSLNKRTKNQAGYFGDVTLEELAESLGTEVAPVGKEPVSQIPKEAEHKTTVEGVVKQAKENLKKIQQQEQPNKGSLIKAEKAMKAAKVAEQTVKEAPVFVIDQVDPKTGKFDGHKTIMGARGFAEAKQMYDAGFADKSGPEHRGAITKMRPEEFKQWKAGDTTKPVKWQEPKLGTKIPEVGTKRRIASEDLVSRIKELGGINSRYLGDKKDATFNVKSIFGKEGESADFILSQLESEGFVFNKDNAPEDALHDALNRYMDGERNFKAYQIERAAEQEAQDRYELQSYTNEEVEQQEAVAAKAKSDARTAEVKDQADKEVKSFVLTGSERTTDVGAARGQADIFDVQREAKKVPESVRRLNPAKYGFMQEESTYETRAETQKKIKERLEVLSKKGKLTPEEVQEVIQIASDEIRAVDETLARTKPLVEAKEPQLGEKPAKPQVTKDEETFAEQRKFLEEQHAGAVLPEKESWIVRDLKQKVADAEKLLAQHPDNKARKIQVEKAKKALEDHVARENDALKVEQQEEEYDAGTKTLIIQHNLSSENLLHADRMGGIPVPSLAITKAKAPMENFGEITLLGGIDMADPKGYAKTKVFGADIYSPRYPEISYKLDKSALKKLNAALTPFRKEGEREIYGGEIHKVDDLTQTDAFKAFMLAKTGKKDFFDLRASDMDAEAAKMLSDIGAEEKLFRGFTYSGNRIYRPHTLENVVKILKKDMRGGENFNYGVGSIRSAFTPQFRSVKQIKQAENRLLGDKEFEAIKEEMNNELIALADEFTDYHSIGNEFGFLDTMSSTLYDAAKMGLPRAFKENGFEEVPQEKLKLAADFLNKLRNLPTEYFEAKILRAVDLSEFKGAVVPVGTKKAVIDALKKRGITNIREYDNSKVGDRAAQIKALAEETGSLFQKEEPYQQEPVKDKGNLQDESVEAQIKRQEQEVKDLEEMAKHDALMQKEERYETDQKDQAEHDIYEGLPVREGTTEKQKQLGRDAYRDILSAYARRAGAAVLGSRIAEDFQEQGGTALHGQSPKTAEDFAVIEQILRDQRIEKARIFYTQKGKFVGHDTFTSKNPGVVQIIRVKKGESVLGATMRTVNTIKRQMLALGADGYWFTHNHPAGTADPSDADINLTKFIAERIKGFQGHVVIDHDQYATINADGFAEVIHKKMPKYFTEEAYEIPHDALNRYVKSVNDMIEVAKTLELKEGFFTLVGRDSRGYVSAVAEFPTSLLKPGAIKELRLQASMKRFAAQTGSMNIVAVIDRAEIAAMEQLVKKGIIVDAVTREGYSARDRVPAQKKTLFGKLHTLQLAEQEEEEYNTTVKPAVEESTQTLRQRGTSAIAKTKEFINKMAPLGNLPNRAEYLKTRYLTQGRIAEVNEGVKELYDAFKDAGDESPNIYQYLTTKNESPLIIKDESLRANAVQAKQMMMDAGAALVERGLLDEKTYEANKGAYLPRLYLRHLLKDQDIVALGTGKKPSDMGYLKQRKDIPEDVRRIILGEITEPGYLASKGFGVQMRDIALMDWLSEISQSNEWILPESVVDWNGKRVTPFYLKAEAGRIRKQSVHYVEQDRKEAIDMANAMDKVSDEALGDFTGVPDGWSQMPDTPRYGAMRGLIVRKEIYDDIVGVTNINSSDTSVAEKILGNGGLATRATQMWKWAKVAANPPAQVRNFISNGILLNLSGVAFHMVPTRVAQAIHDIRIDGQYWNVAKKYGVTESTFAANELVRIDRELLDLEARHAGKLSWSTLKNLLGRMVDFTGDIYQFSEALFKTAKIIDEMKKGKSESDAALEAQKWMFDYSLVSPSVRYLRNAPIGAPFLTFALKALPRMLEVAITHPLRFAPYAAVPYAMTAILAAMTDVDDDDVEKLKKALPMWLQDRGNVYVLPYKDELGRWQVMDFGYFLPWSMWQQLGTEFAQGNLDRAVMSSGLFGGPVVDAIAALKTNIDPFTQKKIVNENDPPATQVASIMGYLYRMGAPTWLTDIGFAGHMYRAMNGYVDKHGDPKSSVGQAALRIGGFNIYPIDPEQTRAENLRRMKFEIAEVKRRKSVVLKDKNLTPEERTEIRREYAEMARERRKQKKEYAQESKVHPNLR